MKKDIDIQDIDLSVANYGRISQNEYDMAILPWGATEPHNRHLPYLTDSILSHAIAVDVAKEAFQKYGILCMVLPPVHFGSQNPGQKDLKFCIHSRYETQKAILADIVRSLQRQGVTRLLIINGHGGNSFKNMLRDLDDEFPRIRIAVSEWFSVCDSEDFFEKNGDHADEKETSVMLHYHPELVSMDLAGDGASGGFRNELLASGKVWMPRRWDKVSNDTGIGDPRMATAGKGSRFVAALVSRYADFIKEFISDDLYRELP